ncbi:DUF2059 domain-containing protein [Rugamonas sp. CCM 8940]|uniref:DUF2059 domain-containing protein n=1 Tax=Rugamonas sp. CCM 8940 TaxID=2765359 RepID=UPI0018F379EC|nr:DUF2059 domain-containing protein [Rugamonas sp. CCM 8940]MBJ7311707.1 DUF2059 domain-containing protein [Rugamonas sp. CCM 8940]
MKKFVAASISSVAALFLLAGAPARAQNTPAAMPVAAAAPAKPIEPAAAAAVKELFVAMNYRALMSAGMQQMTHNLPTMMRNSMEAGINANPQLGPQDKQVAIVKAEARLPAVVKALQEFLSDPKLVDEMMEEIAPLYAANFNVAEIEQLSVFYRSALGAKMLALSPKLMAEGMQIGQRVVARRMAPLMKQLQAADQADKAEAAGKAEAADKVEK